MDGRKDGFAIFTGLSLCSLLELWLLQKTCSGTPSRYRDGVSLRPIFGPSLGEAHFGSALLPCSESSVMRNSNRGPFSVLCSQGIGCVSQASFPMVLTSYEPVRSNSLQFELPTGLDLRRGVAAHYNSKGKGRSLQNGPVSVNSSLDKYYTRSDPSLI